MSQWKTDATGLSTRITNRGKKLMRVASTIHNERDQAYLRKELAETGLTGSALIRALVSEAIQLRLRSPHESAS